MIKSAAFLLIFLASYCNADDTNNTFMGFSFDDDAYGNYDDMPKLDDTAVFGPNAPRDFYVVIIFGLVALQVNLFGSLYVIFRTYLQLKRGGRSNVPLSLRFPFYIALTDAFLSLGYTVNLGYTLVRKLPWSNPACKIIGASVTTLFILNVFLVGIVALTTWSCVCKEYYIEFGPYDYRLWIITSALSVAVIVLTINQSGQQKYWCAGRHHDLFVPIIIIAIIIVILITILFCYIRVLLKIRNCDTLLLPYQRAPIEKRALRKLISYIFTFTLQFIPLIAYNIFILIKVENVLLDVLAITTINFGGISNFAQFVINEGLSHQNKLNSLTSSIEQPQTSVVPKEPISISVTTYEVRDIDDDRSNITMPNSNSKAVGYLSSKNEKSDEYMMKINIDDTTDINNYSYDDTLTTFDATVLISANSSNALLNHDDDY